MLRGEYQLAQRLHSHLWNKLTSNSPTQWEALGKPCLFSDHARHKGGLPHQTGRNLVTCRKQLVTAWCAAPGPSEGDAPVQHLQNQGVLSSLWKTPGCHVLWEGAV